MKKEKIKITLENCEGYTKLHEAYEFNDSERNKINSSATKGLIVTAITFPAGFVLLFTGGFYIAPLIMFGGLATPAISILVQTIAIRKKKKAKVASQYPDIDSNISFDELELALAMNKILKYKEENGKIYDFYDISGYKNYIKANQIKKEMLEEQSYRSFEDDFNVSKEKIDKVKVKVKTMVRK